MNFTINAPPGTTNHGFPGLICVPPQWTDIVSFFLTNYFAHAVTVMSRPGQSAIETTTAVAGALFVPVSGALRTLRYFIIHPATMRKDELQMAAASGALCMVVSDNSLKPDEVDAELPEQELPEQELPEQELPEQELPEQGHTGIDGAVATMRTSTEMWFTRIFTGKGRYISVHRKFHGRLSLPDGYRLFEVPRGAPLKPHSSVAVEMETDDLKSFHIGVSYSALKILVGLFQAIWGVVTLYRARGNQIDLYGYSAFGLSVTPYAFMSIINTVANLVTPEYATMYLVHTPDMDAAREAGGVFHGVIAAVDIDAKLDKGRKVNVDAGGISDETSWLTFLLGLLCIAAPIAIVGGLSGFHSGSASSPSDRGWLMSWLVVGSVSSLWIRSFVGVAEYTDFGAWGTGFLFVLLCAPLFVPAIGGMVTVGRMIQEFGICTDFEM